MAIFFVRVRNLFAPAHREVSQLLLIHESPKTNLFLEIFNGAHIIRAFGKENFFVRKQAENLDNFNILKILEVSIKGWFSIRIHLISILLIIAAASFIIFGDFSAAMAGVIATSIFECEKDFLDFLENLSKFQKDMVSLKRCYDFCSYKPEEIRSQPQQAILPPSSLQEEQQKINFDSKVSASSISFVNVWAKYRQDLNYILKEITFSISSGEKIGILGKTGSGKSSLFMALLRIMPIEKGAIVLGDININEIPLKDLRSSMSVITQNPYLFSGKLRECIDPYSKYTEEQLLNTLYLTHITDILKQQYSESNILDIQIGGNGGNISAGIKQLICLSGAILQKKKIVLIDEATSNIDISTEELLYKNIQSLLLSATVLIISQRVKTVMDLDRVVILDNFQIIEEGNPRELLKNSNSKLYSMWIESSQISPQKK